MNVLGVVFVRVEAVSTPKGVTSAFVLPVVQLVRMGLAAWVSMPIFFCFIFLLHFKKVLLYRTSFHLTCTKNENHNI